MSLFPRPPIDTGDPTKFTTAASTVTSAGRTVDLEIATDGGFYCARVLTYSGCIVALNDDAITEPISTILPNGIAVAYGAAAPNVARIDIHLTDGRIVTVQPQDISNAFNVNFDLIAGPYKSGLGIEQCIAYDAAGKPATGDWRVTPELPFGRHLQARNRRRRIHRHPLCTRRRIGLTLQLTLRGTALQTELPLGACFKAPGGARCWPHEHGHGHRRWRQRQSGRSATVGR